MSTSLRSFRSSHAWSRWAAGWSPPRARRKRFSGRGSRLESCTRWGEQVVRCRGKAVQGAGFSPRVVAKIGEAGSTVLDVITNGEVDLVINTMSNIYTDSAEAGGPVFKDGFEIRRAAVERRIPCLTSLDPAAALLESQAVELGSAQDGEAGGPHDFEVRTIVEWREG